MGIFRPGAALTQVHVYDDADNTNHPAAPGPHTFAEIAAAFPAELAILQDPLGATFNANRIQYLCNADIMLGHPSSGNQNYTSIVDTNVDLYSPAGTAGRTRFRCSNAMTPSNMLLQLGTKIGSGKKMSGKDGCTIHHFGTFVLRTTLGLYGCMITSPAGVLVLQNLSSLYQEIASTIIQGTSSFLLGNADFGALTIYNSTFSSTTSNAIITSSFVSDSYNVVCASTSPLRFIDMAGTNRKVRNLILSGACTASDIRMQAGAANWELKQLDWSDTAGFPRVQHQQVKSADNGAHEYWGVNWRVMDVYGNALENIPIYIESDVDGAIMDVITWPDGDIRFTFPPTGEFNVLPVRDHYCDVPVDDLVRDRLYTITVNGFKSGTYDPVPGYTTRQFKFEWPGRDRLTNSSYQIDGGRFDVISGPIYLPFGDPEETTIWTECNII